MKRLPEMRQGLEAFSRPQIENIEHRLFMKRGLSLGSLALLSGCDVTDTEAGNNWYSGS